MPTFATFATFLGQRGWQQRLLNLDISSRRLTSIAYVANCKVHILAQMAFPIAIDSSNRTASLALRLVLETQHMFCWFRRVTPVACLPRSEVHILACGASPSTVDTSDWLRHVCSQERLGIL